MLEVQDVRVGYFVCGDHGIRWPFVYQGLITVSYSQSVADFVL